MLTLVDNLEYYTFVFLGYDDMTVDNTSASHCNGIVSIAGLVGIILVLML
jgi:hypothetical protein